MDHLYTSCVGQGLDLDAGVSWSTGFNNNNNTGSSQYAMLSSFEPLPLDESLIVVNNPLHNSVYDEDGLNYEFGHPVNEYSAEFADIQPPYEPYPWDYTGSNYCLSSLDMTSCNETSFDISGFTAMTSPYESSNNESTSPSCPTSSLLSPASSTFSSECASSPPSTIGLVTPVPSYPSSSHIAMGSSKHSSVKSTTPLTPTSPLRNTNFSIIKLSSPPKRKTSADKNCLPGLANDSPSCAAFQSTPCRSPLSRKKPKTFLSAPPGPIPATTPTLVRKDEQGVEWIAFEYSKERVKSRYCIRCDVETITVSNLSVEFKTDNCIYPRATVAPELYKGNRQRYETECNCIGWALAFLNPDLRNQRGLIQRAVDSWRNTSSNPTFQSRRVKRMNKRQDRQKRMVKHYQRGGTKLSTEI